MIQRQNLFYFQNWSLFHTKNRQTHKFNGRRRAPSHILVKDFNSLCLIFFFIRKFHEIWRKKIRHKVLCINFNYLCKWSKCTRDSIESVNRLASMENMHSQLNRKVLICSVRLIEIEIECEIYATNHFTVNWVFFQLQRVTIHC